MQKEHQMREKLIKEMVERLGYPNALLSVERALSSLPHLESVSHLPDRRLDLLFFMKDNEDLKPLFLIECKRAVLDRRAFQQLIGYNHYVKAPFLGLAAEDAFLFSFLDPKTNQYAFEKRLPSYQELLEKNSFLF